MRKLLTIAFILLTNLIYSQNFKVVKENNKQVNLQVYISLTTVIINNKEYKLTSEDWIINSLMDKLTTKDLQYIFNKEENNHTLIFKNRIYQLY